METNNNKEKMTLDLLLEIARATTRINGPEFQLEAAKEEEDYARAHIINQEMVTLQEEKRRINSRLEALDFSLGTEKETATSFQTEDSLVNAQLPETTFIWAQFQEDMDVATLKLRFALLKRA